MSTTVLIVFLLAVLVAATGAVIVLSVRIP